MSKLTFLTMKSPVSGTSKHQVISVQREKESKFQISQRTYKEFLFRLLACLLYWGMMAGHSTGMCLWVFLSHLFTVTTGSMPVQFDSSVTVLLSNQFTATIVFWPQAVTEQSVVPRPFFFMDFSSTSLHDFSRFSRTVPMNDIPFFTQFGNQLRSSEKVVGDNQVALPVRQA